MASTVPETRAALLAAAREEFTAHGIAGARTDRIAERAGVNKERIYGHFGSKEKLFDAVIAEVLDECTAVLTLAPDDPAEYVGRTYDFHRENPQLLRLMLWEALHYREEPLPGEDQRADRYARKVTGLAEALGTERNPEVAMTLLSLIGLAAWPHALPQLARLIFRGAGDDTEITHQMVRDHIVAFTRRALDSTTA